ncbi:hypothetical protein [Ketobacter sp.]|uniref:hypothetical protein n=1 Tax=Ketobacter sp. TaxID=2083498 RepID=UPI000F24EE94|nr:hypothetical protein [Ketobacter sp.]RLU00982.1 MAG: hypothetical protein D9N14_04370 [Ketobacter sp.]
MIISRYFLLALAFNFALPITANAESFEFNWLQSGSGQKSALSGRCRTIGESDSSLECNLRQISAAYDLDPDELDNALQKIRTELEDEMKNKSPEELVKKSLGDSCPLIKQGKVPFADAHKELLVIMNRLCDKPTRQDIYRMAEYTKRIESRTCKMTEFDLGDFNFKKVHDNKWVSNNGPVGLCSAIVVMVLERHSQHSYLWSYSQSKQYTDLSTDMCKELNRVNEPQTFSWNAPKPFPMKCDFIEFGL